MTPDQKKRLNTLQKVAEQHGATVHTIQLDGAGFLLWVKPKNCHPLMRHYNTAGHMLSDLALCVPFSPACVIRIWKKEKSKKKEKNKGAILQLLSSGTRGQTVRQKWDRYGLPYVIEHYTLSPEKLEKMREAEGEPEQDQEAKS